MGKFINLIYMTFENWTVIERAANGKNGQARWLCKCKCKNERIVDSNNLRSGKSRSCGCLFPSNNITHHKTDTRLYNIHCSMKQRCYDSSNHNYYKYGARGIRICDEWLNKESGFITFYNWAIENGYEEKLSIDRKDVNGNYEPNNCRWATSLEQGNNKRNNIIIEFNGEEKTITEWSRIYNIDRNTIYQRYWDGKRGRDLFLPLKIIIANKQSGIKGITWTKKGNKWTVGVYIKKKRVHIGHFKLLGDAIKAKNEYIENKNKGDKNESN